MCTMDLANPNRRKSKRKCVAMNLTTDKKCKRYLQTQASKSLPSIEDSITSDNEWKTDEEFPT